MADAGTNLAIGNEALREEAAKIATACVNDAIAQRRTLEAEWADAESLWNRRSLTKFFPRDEVKHVPEPYNRVEVIQPRFYKGVFGVARWFAVEARKREARRYEDELYDFLVWQAEANDRQFYTDQDDGIREVCIFGTIFYKMDWKVEQRYVATRDITSRKVRAEDGTLVGEKVEPGDLKFEEREYGFPRAKPLNVRQVYVDRWVNNLLEARYVGNEFHKTVAEIEALTASSFYTNTEKLTEGIREPTWRDRQGRELPKKMANVLFVEMWTAMEIDRKYVPVVITMALDKAPIRDHPRKQNEVVRIERNTFPGGLRPYAVGHYIKRPGEIYGVGALIPVRGLSQELDEWRTMHSRHAELSVSPPLVAHDDFMEKDDQMLLYPGRVFYSRMGADGIKPMALPFNQMSVAHIERTIRGDIGQTTKSPESFMGATGQGRETAFEIQSRNQESGMTLSQIIGRYRIEVVKPILRTWLALDAMHVDEKQTIRVVGAAAVKNPIRTIQPEILQLEYDFKILDSAEVALMGNVSRQIVSFMQAVSPEAAAVVRWDRIIEKFFKSIGEENAREFMRMELTQDDLLSPAEEMQMVLANEQPPIERELPMEVHQFHLASHQMAFSSDWYADLTAQQKWIFQRHMAQTGEAVQKAMQRKVMQQEALRRQAMAQGQRGGRQRQGSQQSPTAALQQVAGQNQGG